MCSEPMPCARGGAGSGPSPCFGQRISRASGCARRRPRERVRPPEQDVRDFRQHPALGCIERISSSRSSRFSPYAAPGLPERRSTRPREMRTGSSARNTGLAPAPRRSSSSFRRSFRLRRIRASGYVRKSSGRSGARTPVRPPQGVLERPSLELRRDRPVLPKCLLLVREDPDPATPGVSGPRALLRRAPHSLRSPKSEVPFGDNATATEDRIRPQRSADWRGRRTRLRKSEAPLEIGFPPRLSKPFCRSFPRANRPTGKTTAPGRSTCPASSRPSASVNVRRRTFRPPGCP